MDFSVLFVPSTLHGEAERYGDIMAQTFRQGHETHLRPAHAETGKDMQDMKRRGHGAVTPARGA